MTRSWLFLALVIPGVVGCAPDGPHEIYRSALQARSEFVDSLSRVVDEESARSQYLKADKVFTTRMQDIKTGLDRVKFDGTFNKLRRGNFDLKHIDLGDRVSMIAGIRSYVEYCKNIVFTNVRLRRELERLNMIANLQLAAAVKAQLDANQPITVNHDTASPNVNSIFAGISKTAGSDLRFVPSGITVEDLAKLEHGVPAEDIQLILTFRSDSLDGKVPDMEPPPLPEYPAWAVDLDRQVGGGILRRFPGIKKPEERN